MCVCVRVCMRACVRACVCVCARVCIRPSPTNTVALCNTYLRRMNDTRSITFCHVWQHSELILDALNHRQCTGAGLYSISLATCKATVSHATSVNLRPKLPYKQWQFRRKWQRMKSKKMAAYEIEENGSV